MAKSGTADLPKYADLKARAKELGINPVGVRGPDLHAQIQVEEARLAAAAASPGDQATADAAAAANVTPDGSGAESSSSSSTDGAPRSARNAKAVEIVRQNAVTWWCPIDGFSMPQYMQGCEKCGARRDGDKVYPTRSSD